MNDRVPVLSVTGSDCSGGAGVQADVKTIADMGGYPLTAVTAITIQNQQQIVDVHRLPTSLVVDQVHTVVLDMHPRAVKVGLVCDAETVKALRDEIVGCRSIVLDPGIVSGKDGRVIDGTVMQALVRWLIPEATLLMLKCSEAALLLDKSICSNEDMEMAARALVDMGAQWVLLRGGSHIEGQLTALLYGESKGRFFTTYNTEGWQRHGIGGVFSTAIATRLAMGDAVPDAISKAHEYVHSQVVYATAGERHMMRPHDLYHQFLSLISEYYRTAHDVAFYADKLCITPRYLSQVTDRMAAKSPKEVIADSLMHEAHVLLESTRLSIQEIADRLGFSSLPMFCRFFKQHEGCTPSDFRR